MSLKRGEIIRMASDAGFDTDKFERSCTPQKCDIDIFDELSRFANAAYSAGAEAERKACADIADEMDWWSGAGDAIRARGDK